MPIYSVILHFCEFVRFFVKYMEKFVPLLALHIFQYLWYKFYTLVSVDSFYVNPLEILQSSIENTRRNDQK